MARAGARGPGRARDEVLAAWGTAARKPLAGHVTFFGTDRRTAREMLSWTAGECVGYHEVFVSGDGGAGAYGCQLVIAGLFAPL